ncbi:hypothetical protein [uncultured Weissella sp.]|uniref:hypothetical protein n=1 Tax=uncultured Weissella sp. TaxID=253243 RepID=UPI002585CE01|nr:hypothetical protein [uncultured Weissella sp.]
MRGKLLFLSTLSLVFLVGSTNINASSTKHKNDYISLYNAHDKKIKTITSKKSIEYLSDFAGDVSGNKKGIHKKQPNKAKLAYKYVFHSGKKHKISYKLNLYVYPNVNKIKMTNLPVVSNGVWSINKKQMHKLGNPEKYFD